MNFYANKSKQSVIATFLTLLFLRQITILLKDLENMIKLVRARISLGVNFLCRKYTSCSDPITRINVHDEYSPLQSVVIGYTDENFRFPLPGCDVKHLIMLQHWQVLVKQEYLMISWQVVKM